MKIYVASSWRNHLQPGIVHILRRCGHEVYDFRRPAPGVSGFAWSAIDPNWKNWTAEEYGKALQHPIARRGYAYDIEAIKNCDACVLVLPSGRSASWELGYAMGLGKAGYVMQLDNFEPELMYAEARFIPSIDVLFEWFEQTEEKPVCKAEVVQGWATKTVLSAPGWRAVDPGPLYHAAWEHSSGARIFQINEEPPQFVYALPRENINIERPVSTIDQAVELCRGSDGDPRRRRRPPGWQDDDGGA